MMTPKQKAKRIQEIKQSFQDAKELVELKEQFEASLKELDPGEK